MKLSNKVYDVLAYLSAIAIPAIVVFLNTVLTALNCPYTEVITIIVGAIGVLLGSLIRYSSYKYKKEGDSNE